MSKIRYREYSISTIDGTKKWKKRNTVTYFKNSITLKPQSSKINFMFSSILPIPPVYSHFVAFAFFSRQVIITPESKSCSSLLWPQCPHSYLFQVSLPLPFVCVKQYQEICENQYLISYSNIFSFLSPSLMYMYSP